MSKLSIYEDPWINMVFEGKNQQYGAYQLRHDSNKTMLFAFLFGLLIVSSFAVVPVLIKNLSTEPIIEETPPIILDEIIDVTLINPPQPQKPKTFVAPIAKKTDPEVKDKEILKNPEIVKPLDANDNIATNNEAKDIVPNVPEGNATNGIPSTKPTTGTGISDTKTPDTNIINTTAVLDKMPEFPGGMQKFYTYVGRNFEKPELEVSKTMKIYVYFVIEKDGSMTDIKVLKDPGYGLGQEAIRVLKSLKTKWEPGIINGKSVRTSYNLPIVVEMR